MNILILGGGGREHALAWAIRQNPKCDRLIVAPGNAGIAQIARCAALDIEDPAAVVEFCGDHTIDLVVVGPEAPLAAGVSDALREAGLRVFGPSKAAAQLEASKRFTKEICDACGAPTAAWRSFDHIEAAREYLLDTGAPAVIKQDGLAAGKGVVVAMTDSEAMAALDDAFAQGGPVVIEEFMAGEEASLFYLCDGKSALAVGTAQDHKRVGEGDTGPNTGGMGAYSPAPVVTPEIAAQVHDEIVAPTLAEMARRGMPFEGVLYAGVMIEHGRARLVEYNVRFGDPEAQPLMMRLGAQILDLIEAALDGRLDQITVNWADDHAMCVVLAAEGYPGAVVKGSAIGGLDNLPENASQMMFHAGTTQKDSKICASGGRVLGATGRGASLKEAATRAYAMADAVEWPEGFYRRDIGWRALD